VRRVRRTEGTAYSGGTPGPRTLDDVLRDYGIPALASHVVVVEGTIDRDYFELAVRKAKEHFGCDLGEVPDGRGASSRIQWLVPKRGGGDGGGGAGAGEVATFGRELHPFFRGQERPAALMFILDNDQAGDDALRSLLDVGYHPDYHLHQHDVRGAGVLCLNRTRMVLVEDLLSLSIQRQYFDAGKRTARVDIHAGVPCRFEWFGREKVGLRQFVLEHATLEDIAAFVSLVVEIRLLWGIGVPAVVSEWMPRATPEGGQSAPADARVR